MACSDLWKTTLGGLDLSGPCEIQFQKYQLIPSLISQIERFTSFTLTLNNSKSVEFEARWPGGEIKWQQANNGPMLTICLELSNARWREKLKLTYLLYSMCTLSFCFTSFELIEASFHRLNNQVHVAEIPSSHITLWVDNSVSCLLCVSFNVLESTHSWYVETITIAVLLIVFFFVLFF